LPRSIQDEALMFKRSHKLNVCSFWLFQNWCYWPVTLRHSALI
jgi:hypothetical protein